MQRILIVNVNWVGDVLFSTPAIRAIKKKYPKSFIACLVPMRCTGILAQNPHLDEIITISNKRTLFSLFESIRLILKLKKMKFDTAVFFHRSRTRAFLCLVAGIRRRLGYAQQPERRFLTHVFPLPRKPLHKTDFFLNLVTALGVEPDGRVPDFFPKKTTVNPMAGLDYVAVHAGGNWTLKRWPATFFSEWIRLFGTAFPKIKIVLCGSEAEKPLIEGILKSCPGANLVSLAGKTSIDELAVLLRDAKIVVSNDSGPIHLAASQNTKIIGLYGPTRPDLTGPITDAPCIIMHKDPGCELPCYFRSCAGQICMELLTPAEIFQKSSELLEAKNSG